MLLAAAAFIIGIFIGFAGAILTFAPRWDKQLRAGGCR